MTELPPAAAPARLTAALRRCGALGDGCVREVGVGRAFPTILSRILQLRLTYDGAAGDAPTSLILKTGLPERASPTWNAGPQEVAFYTQMAEAMPAGPLPRCFAAHWDATTRDWHLLLEDLTDSHAIPTVWPLPPSTEQCERIVTALARFHAGWWDDARLGVAVGTRLDAAGWRQYVQRATSELPRFIDRLGDRLPPERRALYERLVDAMPRLLARHHGKRNLTIGHGDLHAWNCFLPRDGGVDVRLIDWDSWRIGPGTDDLGYMMAMHWYPDRRRRLERPLLDRYHADLSAHGVRGYDRAALDDDYRLSVLWLLMRPLWQAASDIPPVIWWNNLERIVLAVDDLDCRALLD